MAKKNENTKPSTKYVTLGDSAYNFYDPATGIQIIRGEVKELSIRQVNNPKIRRALHNGHLQYTETNVKGFEPDEEEVESLEKRFTKMVTDGMEAKKIAKAFNKEEITQIAEIYGYEIGEASPEELIQTIITNELEK